MFFRNNNKKSIKSVSVISSSLCNLRCSFCYLHKNKAYPKFDEIVQEAWKNGSYVDNILKVFEKFKIPPSDLEIIQLWGGETLLNIQNVIPNIKNFYKYFPNINSWKISTNWMINVDNFFDFLKEIDNHTNCKDTNIRLQVSIDGPPGKFTEQGHHGDWRIYKINFERFCNLVNNYKFHNIKIEIHINATVGKELYLEEFSTKEGIYNYLKFTSDFCDWLNEQCISSSLSCMADIVAPGYAIPCNSTSAEGRKLAEIFRLWEEVKAEYFPKFNKYFNIYYGIGDITANKNYFSCNLECSEMRNSLTIIPDGTIVECSGSYIDQFQPYVDELKKENNTELLNNVKARSKIVKNILNMTEEELEEYSWLVDSGYKGNSSTYMHTMFSICKELGMSGQIPYKYVEDDDLLLKHLSCLSNLISCTRENINDTKIPYLASTSCFRRYLNGAIEYAYDLKTLELKDRMRREIR